MKISQIVMIACGSLLGWALLIGAYDSQANRYRFDDLELSLARLNGAVKASIEESERRHIERLGEFSERLAGIESSRFTARDAAGLTAEVTEVWRAIGECAKRDEVPPQWFRDLVYEGHARIKRLEDVILHPISVPKEEGP